DDPVASDDVFRGAGSPRRPTPGNATPDHDVHVVAAPAQYAPAAAVLESDEGPPLPYIHIGRRILRQPESPDVAVTRALLRRVKQQRWLVATDVLVARHIELLGAKDPF